MSSFMDHFANNPVSVNLQRSTFRRDCRHKTSFNEGSLVPFFCDEVLPGDTFNLKTASLVRLSNPAVRPVMDDMYLDIYYFFVPSRLIYARWEELCGTNKSSYWAPSSEVTLPFLTSSAPVARGSFMNYLGVGLGFQPTSNANGLNPLPYGAYSKIYNEWFRSEDFIAPDSAESQVYNATSGAPINITNAFVSSGIFKVSRYFDYFSSCLPSPQKAVSPVSVPLGTSAPVSVNVLSQGVFNGPSGQTSAAVTYSSSTGGKGYIYSGGSQLQVSSQTANGTADLSQATAATINELRQAFQLQRLFEKDARGGSRYTETLHSHFGVSNPDARLQRSEFLGGSHTLLNMTQVQQTAPSSGTGNALGQLGAYSLTNSFDGSFVKSFTEYGYILGLAVVRVKHSYSQGIPRFLTRNRRFDFYWPALANLGEQPVYTREMYFSATWSQVWGFQEAWADYRYKPDLVTGMVTPGNTADMTAWTFGDHYTSTPTLNASWLGESSSNIDQTLAVPSATADQFIADFGVMNKCTRCMPLYSVPGLIDHN